MKIVLVFKCFLTSSRWWRNGARYKIRLRAAGDFLSPAALNLISASCLSRERAPAVREQRKRIQIESDNYVADETHIILRELKLKGLECTTGV